MRCQGYFLKIALGTRLCINVCMYVYMYVCMYVWMDGCMYVFMDGCMYVYMFVCMCVCVNMVSGERRWT